MVGVVGSVWGTLPDAGAKDELHHWNRKAGDTDWKTACSLVAPMDEFFGGIPVISLRVRRNAEDGPLCAECLAHYPETEVGALMEGKVLPP
jgi:hypothetical protein